MVCKYILFDLPSPRFKNTSQLMKNSLFLITFVLFAGVASAQSNSFDERLLSKFSKNELNEMQTVNPVAYAYWSFYAGNSYQVMDLPDEKTKSHEIKGTVKIKDVNTINIFDLHYTPLTKDYQYYRIEGTNKLLVILSEEIIKENFVKSTKK